MSPTYPTLPTEGIYANVFVITGDSQDINNILNDYTKDKNMTYPFDIRIPFKDVDSLPDNQRYILNAEEYLNYLAILKQPDEYNYEVINGAYETLFNKLLNVYKRCQEYVETTNTPFPKWEEIQHFIEVPESPETMIAKLESLTETLKQIDPSLTQMLFDYNPEEENIDSFYLLNEEELIENVEAMNLITVDGNTIVGCVLTKHGTINEYLQEIMLAHSCEGHLYFGNGNVAGHFLFEKGKIFIDSKEPSLNEIVGLLDLLGLTDYHLERFKWNDFDLHKLEDDEEFLANEPAFGVH